MKAKHIRSDVEVNEWDQKDQKSAPSNDMRSTIGEMGKGTARQS